MLRTNPSSGDSNSGYIATPLLVTLYEFDIYRGRKDAPELGLGKNVVLYLTKKLPGISVFAENYFGSPTLAALLHDRGMNFVGVVRKDRKG